MKRITSLSLLLCIAALCLATGVFAQAGKFSVQFDNTPLSRVLDAFKRFDPNLQFSLAADLAETRITASLVDVTVDEALQVVLGQAGLMSVKDAGVYQIRQKPEARGPRSDRPALRLPPPVFLNRATTPGGADVSAGAAPAATKAETDKEQQNPPLRLIMIRFADPYDLADLFGGSVVEGGGMSGGSGSSGGSGYGSSSSGSSRGSNRNSDSGNNSSSSRSSRSSSRSSGSNY